MDNLTINTIDLGDISTPSNDVSATIKSIIQTGKPVLWLVSGGSALKIAVETQKRLSGISDFSKITVSLVDERFGKVGHKDSNWKQLLDLGWQQDTMQDIPVLRNDSNSVGQTSEDFNNMLADYVKKDYAIVGIFGIGPDGHTAGLLPGNPVMESFKLADSYKGFDHKRITITPKFFSHINHAFVYALGSSKTRAIEDFIKNNESYSDPAKSIYKSRAITLYTDYKGGA